MVRRWSAKPLFAGSIPAPASIFVKPLLSLSGFFIDPKEVRSSIFYRPPLKSPGFRDIPESPFFYAVRKVYVGRQIYTSENNRKTPRQLRAAFFYYRATSHTALVDGGGSLINPLHHICDVGMDGPAQFYQPAFP